MSKGTPLFTEALREILKGGRSGNQEEICSRLKKMGYPVTQSTISRGLRKLGAVRAVDGECKTFYKLSDEGSPLIKASLRDLVLEISSNGSMIVIRTSPGSASLVARHLDSSQAGGLLGTIAGDDTIFAAPDSLQKIPQIIKAIEASLLENRD